MKNNIHINPLFFVAAAIFVIFCKNKVLPAKENSRTTNNFRVSKKNLNVYKIHIIFSSGWSMIAANHLSCQPSRMCCNESSV